MVAQKPLGLLGCCQVWDSVVVVDVILQPLEAAEVWDSLEAAEVWDSPEAVVAAVNL